MSDGFHTHVQALLEGQTIRFRPHGNSMVPLILSGQLVTVRPLTEDEELSPGTVVLCKVEGRQMLHRLTAIGSDGRYQISNNHGHINGWCTRKNVFGVLESVEP